jgi:hypothetical protein
MVRFVSQAWNAIRRFVLAHMSWLDVSCAV